MTGLLNGCEVLIVEDELLIQLDLQFALEEAGASVFTAASVAEGMEALNRSLAVAILDVRLSDGEVYPVANALSQKGVPLVFHSGHANPDDLCNRFPGAMTVPKPSPERVLIETVRRQAAC